MFLTLITCSRYLFRRISTCWNIISTLRLYSAVILRRRTKSLKNPQIEVIQYAKSERDSVKFISRKNPVATMNESGEKLQRMFDAAVKVIQCLPKDGAYQPSNSTKLRFYSLYKQSTEGKCNQPQPSIFYLVDRAKWDAWNKLGNMSKIDAMKEYVEELKLIVETMSLSGDVQDFLEAVNPFYEFVNLHGVEMSAVKESLDQWVSSSESNSTNTSTQVSPLHNGIDKQNEWTTRNGHDLHKSNEHTSDKESLEFVTKTITTSHTFASPFNPPSAPIHRRSTIAHCTSLDFDNSFCPVARNSKDDDILKVDTDETLLYPHLSADNLDSPTDSERYYSDDNEGDIDLPEPPVVVALPGTSTSIVQFNSIQSQGPGSPTEVNLILANTVDRLNRDMEHILARVRLLEAAYATTEQITQAAKDASLKSQEVRIFGLTRPALTLILAWPFVAIFIINLVKLWLRRRYRGGRV